MTEHLFNPDPFTKGQPKKARPKKERLEPTTVRVGGRWKYATKTELAHHWKGRGLNYSFVFACGLTSGALTVEDGTAVPACEDCLKAHPQQSEVAS